jgi:hypothetical protein
VTVVRGTADGEMLVGERVEFTTWLGFGEVRP